MNVEKQLQEQNEMLKYLNMDMERANKQLKDIGDMLDELIRLKDIQQDILSEQVKRYEDEYYAESR